LIATAPVIYAAPSHGDCAVRPAGGSSVGYLTSVTIGGRIVTRPTVREADIQQAEIFHSLLAEQRAELCNRLDEQAIQLARYEHSQDSDGARRKRLRIKEIGAEIRDIDRMIHALTGRLLVGYDPRSRAADAPTVAQLAQHHNGAPYAVSSSAATRCNRSPGCSHPSRG
jgi:hypothetical protein